MTKKLFRKLEPCSFIVGTDYDLDRVPKDVSVQISVATIKGKRMSCCHPHVSTSAQLYCYNISA